LLCYGAAKTAFRNRKVLAGQLRMKEADIELVEGDVGGGFGARGGPWMGGLRIWTWRPGQRR